MINCSILLTIVRYDLPENVVVLVACMLISQHQSLSHGFRHNTPFLSDPASFGCLSLLHLQISALQCLDFDTLGGADTLG